MWGRAAIITPIAAAIVRVLFMGMLTKPVLAGT
jgi:hypothetical protein